MTEHCFNLSDGEHVEGTSRFMFNFPEIWYVNQSIKDMSIGIRSIILKPEPVFVNFQDLYVLGDDSTIQNSINNSLNVVKINGQLVLPNQMYIDMGKSVDERVDILSFVNWANEKMVSDLDHHMDICQSAYGNLNLVDLSRYSVYFQYDSDGSLLFACNEHSNFSIKFKVADLTNGNYGVWTFNSGFHKLVGLDHLKEDTNINSYLSNIVEVLSQPTIDRGMLVIILEDAKKNGIEILIDPNTIDLKEDRTLGVDTTSTLAIKPALYKQLLFKGIRIHNVWSRKDVMIRSSLCEMDKRGYLGFSSNYSNSAQAIYPQPKIYDVNNRNSKFWIELFDSYTQKAINILNSNMLLIEAIVYQKPKRTFNRT